MKKDYATSWKRSVQPRKQRKYLHNAPLHRKSKQLASNLDKPLREKYKRRSIRVRTGDKVKVMRGSNKGKEGKVERVDVQRAKVYVTKIERTKPDGTKTPLGLHASALKIVELNLDDKKRKAKLEKQNG